MQIVTKDEMYAIDRKAMQLGLRGEMLMENAGQAVVNALLRSLSKDERIMIVIGKGNNGGDGFVIARMLKSYGYDVAVWLAAENYEISGDAKKAMLVYERSSYDYRTIHKESFEAFRESLAKSTLVIDALLGIGVKGMLRTPYKEIISLINAQQGKRIVAIDLPSGVSADGGPVADAIQAHETIVIHHPKLGAFTYPSRHFYGDVHVVNIGIPPAISDQVEEKRFVWTSHDVMRTFPERSPTAHKGDYGKGLLIGGSKSMSGAITMSAKAALRSGSGLITIAMPEEAVIPIASRVMEAMYMPCPSELGQFSGEFSTNLNGFDAIAIGPGMGRREGSRNMIKKVIERPIPLLIDADGLFHLSSMKERLRDRVAPTIVTPHEGEMARLLGVSVEEVNRSRFQLSRQFAMEYGVYLVLKGPFTICTTPTGCQYVNSTGNVSLAKGGSGDVLTGIMLAFMMQGDSLQEAICNATFVHGLVSDELVSKEHSPIDLIASDLIAGLPRVYKLIASRSL